MWVLSKNCSAVNKEKGQINYYCLKSKKIFIRALTKIKIRVKMTTSIKYLKCRHCIDSYISGTDNLKKRTYLSLFCVSVIRYARVFFVLLKYIARSVGRGLRFPKRTDQKISIKEANKVKESVFKSHDDLPLFLNADVVGKVLGVSISSAYELMHEKDFPSVRIGNRLIIPKDKFIGWVNAKAER